MMLMVKLILTSMVIPGILLMVSLFTGHSSYNHDRHQLSVFECGFDSFNSARMPFSLRFFMLAIIFIMFDIEITMILSMPLLNNLAPMSCWGPNMATFFVIIFLGTIHEWNEGSFSWSS